MSTVSVRFSRFWPGFAPKVNFFTRVIEAALACRVEVVTGKRASADLDFVSVFQGSSERLKHRANQLGTRGKSVAKERAVRWALDDQKPPSNARRAIWYTGENVRPPSGAWHGYASFDLDDFDGKNVYLPLWQMLLDWFGESAGERLGSAISVDGLLSSGNVDLSGRDKFCCAFIGNDHPMRHHAIKKLEEIAPVDVYGRSVGRPVVSKMEVASRYRFILCFENDYYPGYVTEKPVEGWWTGAIPIWWGCDAARFLNPSAMVVLDPVRGFGEMLQEVESLWRNEESWRQMRSEPLLRAKPTLEPIFSLIQRAMDSAPFQTVGE